MSQLSQEPVSGECIHAVTCRRVSTDRYSLPVLSSKPFLISPFSPRGWHDLENCQFHSKIFLNKMLCPNSTNSINPWCNGDRVDRWWATSYLLRTLSTDCYPQLNWLFWRWFQVYLPSSKSLFILGNTNGESENYGEGNDFSSEMVSDE